MSRTFLVALLGGALLFAGLLTLQAPLVGLSIPVFVYILAGLWRGSGGIHLEAERTLSAERVLTGDEVTVNVTITNRGRGLEEILCEDVIPEGLEVVKGSERHLVALPAGRAVSWEYSLRGRRGYYTLSRIMITARDSLGLIPLQRALSTDGQLFILPPTLRLRRVAIQPRRTRVYSGTIPAHQGGTGVEFFGVREYQFGDPPRSINWHTTARHPDGLYSNEFEQERVVDVGIILDGRCLTNEFGRRSIFEHSVLAAASLADALLNAGNRVGLLFFGRQVAWTLPGYGKLQSERILHDLSRLQAGNSMAFTGIFIPRHLFPAHSQLILVSPLTTDDFSTLSDLRSRGYNLLVISPNPVAFEYAGLPQTDETRLARRIIQIQRTTLLRRLRGLGVQVVDWDISEPFEQVARRDLERRAAQVRGIQR